MNHPINYFKIKKTINTDSIKIISKKKKKIKKKIKINKLELGFSSKKLKKQNKNIINTNIKNIVLSVVDKSLDISFNKTTNKWKNADYSKYIGIIPLYSSNKWKTVKTNNKINIHNTFMLLKKSTYFPVIPYKKKKDIMKHIRINTRKILGITKSQILSIDKLTNVNGMDIYLININNIKKICNGTKQINNKDYNTKFTWKQNLYMYYAKSHINHIYSHMIDKNSTFNILNNKDRYYPHIINNDNLVNYKHLPYINKLDIIKNLASQGKLGIPLSSSK